MRSIALYDKYGSILRGCLSLFMLLFFACKEQPPKKISDEGLKPKDFMNMLPELSLPLQFDAKKLSASLGDAQKVHIPTFQTYLPDSLYRATIMNTDKSKLYVLGKVTANDKSVYVFVKTHLGKQQNISVLYFDEKLICRGRLLLLDSKNNKTGSAYTAKVDARYNFYLIHAKKLSDGSEWSGEKVYYFDLTGLPIMAVTNTNEDLSNKILGNPIDSFPAKNKYAGDYSSDKQNLVSIRDGRTEKMLQFFIHFSKLKGGCIGELKGEAEWVNKQLAVFRDSKSPCVIEFRFSPKSVSIRETTGCGSYRDMNCIFEGSFPKIKKMQFSKTSKMYK